MSRVEKVQEEIRQQVSLIVLKDLNDPTIGFITITRVKITADLRDAKIYFTTMADEESLEYAVNGLKRAVGFIRKLIGERMRMKFVPEIKFIYDESEKKSNRIDEIIEIIHREKETSHGDKGDNKGA